MINKEELGKSFGQIGLKQGTKFMKVSQRSYWESTIDNWRSKMTGMESILEEIQPSLRGNEPSSVKITIKALKNFLIQHMMLKLAEEEDLTPHGFGRELKGFKSLVEFVRKKSMPTTIMQEALRDNFSSNTNFEQLFGHTYEILRELRELEDSVQEELDFKFGKYQEFGLSEDLKDFKDFK